MENMATLQECIPLNWQYEPQREWLCVSVTWRNEKLGQRLALQQTTPGVRPQVHNEHSRCYTAPAPHVFIIHSRLLWLKFPHKLFSVLFQTISPLILNLTEQRKKKATTFHSSSNPLHPFKNFKSLMHPTKPYLIKWCSWLMTFPNKQNEINVSLKWKFN